MTLKKYLLLIFLLPIFSFGQTITDIVVTTPINCYNDPECVDVEFQNLNSGQSYNLRIYIDNGTNTFPTLSNIFLDIASNANFSSSGNESFFNHCFVGIGKYKIELLDSDNNILSTLIHETDLWPFPLGLTDVSSSSGKNLDCNGDSDGELQVAGTGGTPPLVYNWSGPNGFSVTESSGTFSIINNLSAGTYLVSISDVNGCNTPNDIITVNQPSPINPNISTVSLETCNDDQDAVITANPFGGNGGPYSFEWNNGILTADNIVGAGTYSLVVQDVQGCFSPSTSYIVDPTPPLVAQAPVVIDPLCVENQGQVAIDVSGGTGVISYEWPNGTSTSSNNSLDVDDYTITIKDQNDCSIQSSFSISPADSILANITVNNNVTCFGNADAQIVIQISGGSPTYTVDQVGLNTGSTSFTINNNSNNIFNNLDVDSYQFFVSDNNACTNNNYPAQLLIVEPEEIILSSNNVSNISCFGENDGSINVTVQGGSGSYTYTWFDSNNSILGGNTNSISGLSADVYTLSVNDGVCQQSFDFTIIEPSPIILTSSVPNNISCSGSNDGFISNTVIDGGVAPYDYEWQSTSGVLLTDANPFNLSPSDYSLRVVDANNCPSLLLVTHTITEPNPLELLSSSSFNNPSCHNVNDGSIDVLANGGSPSYTFLLTEINTLISYGGSLVSDLPAGNYVLEVIDVNNCIDSTIFTFNNPLPLDFTTQISDLSCFDYNDGKIVFDFSTPNPPYTIELTNPQNNTQIVIDSVLGLSSGTYISTLTDASGCQQILTDVINSPDPILVNVTSESPSCNQNDVNQNNLISNGSLSLDISGASGIYDIIFDEDTSQAQLGIVYSLNNLSAGNYEVEVKDELGCSTIISETVPSASEIIVYTESQTDIVVNGSNTGSIQINPTGGLPPYDTDWLGPNFSSTSEDITNLFSGVYDLTITDNNGCVDFYTYSVNEDDCDISINPNIVPVECPGQNALVNFTISNGIAPYNCYMQGDIDGDNVIDEILPNQSINSSLVNSLSLPSGPYTLEVRDQSDCVQIYNFVIDQIDPIEINPELIDVSCYGENDGKILIDNVIGNSDISGGTVAGTYDVQVQGLDLQDVNPFSLTAGEYIVLVLDDNDCPQTEYYTIQEPEEIIINDTLISHPNCSSETNFPGSDGEITVIPQGGNTNGTGIYLYSWGAPISSSLQTVTNLAPSTYNVSITDANNCTTNHFITLDEPDIIEYSIISSQPISCFNACDGEVTITTSNSENEFFNWFYNNDSLLVGNTNTISSLCEGSYSVSITNDKNCLWNSPEQGIGSEILTNPVEFSFDVNQSTPVQNGICDGFASINNIIGFGPFTYDWSNGETTSFVDDLCGEGYVVTVTDGSGCSSTKGFVIEEEECDFEIGALQVIQPECFGDNDGQIISFDAFNGGSAPYTVRRYAGSNDPVEEFITSNNILNFSSLSDGSYSIFVEDAGGCWDVFDTTIVSPLPISYSYYLENVDCYSTFDPEVHLTIVGGTQFEGSSPYIVNFPYEYYLATEQNGIESYVSGSPIVEGTSNNLFVTDANGCPPETFVVSVPPIDIINLGLTLTDPTCPNDNDGSATLSIVGGVSPYEINWYKVGNIVPLNGSTIDVLFIDTLVGGDYYIDVKDANGCNSIINFTINEMPDFVVNPIINLPSCIGESDATIFVQISGSNTDGSENLLWSPGSQTSNFVSGLQSGSYDLSITDSEQCTYTETIIVEDPEEIDLVLTTSPISCTGEGDGSISVSASGGNPNPNYQYQWYINGGEISSLEGGISDLIVNLNPATYSVVVTDNNGCEAELDQELVDPNPIEITSIESSNPKCFGSSDGSIVVTVAGEESDFIFSLKDGLGVEISSFSSANNLLADSYTLTVTDQYNCQLEESIVLIDPADLVIDVLAVDAICNGENTGSASFSIENHTEPLDIIWSSVQSLSSSVSFSFAETVSNLSIGNYNIQVTDAIGCSKTESFEILQPDPIVISTTVTPSNCANENGATAFASSTNAAAPVNYLWVINQGDNISQVGNQAINLGVGDIYLSGVDNNNCPIPQTVVNIGPSLNLLAQVEIVIEEENKCFNDNIAKIKAELSYSDGSPIIGIPAYQWYVDGVLIPSNLGGTVSTLVNVGPGTYSVDVTLSGCTNSDTIELVNPEQIEINIQNTIDVNCYGQNTGSVLASVSNGNAPLTYELDNLMGFTINNNLDNLNGLEAGDYNLIVTDNNNCVQSQEFVITQNDSLELNLSSISTKCFESSDGEILSNVSGGFGNIIYSWTNSNNVVISENASFSENISSQYYTLSVVDDLGCENSDSVFVDQPTPLLIQETINNVDCFGESTGSIFLSVSGGTAGYDYNWDDSPFNSNQLINLSEGSYEVNISDDNGCIENKEYTVGQLNQIDADSEGSFVSCLEGTANITNITGGSGSYQIIWEADNSVDDFSISGLPIGLYHTFYIYDTNGCMFTDSVLINETNEIPTNIVVNQNILCFEDSTSSINVNLINGTNFPYSYSLNNTDEFSEPILASNFVIDNLPAGSYTIFIKDGDECIDTAFVLEEITQPDELMLISMSSDVSCNGEINGTIDLDINGGVGPYNISLDGGNTTFLTNVFSSNFLVEQGVYDVVVSDQNNCKVNVEEIIEEPSALVVELSQFSDYNGFNLSCFESNDGSFLVEASGGTGSYTLEVTGVLNESYDFNSILLFENLSSGNYSLSVIDENECSFSVDTFISTPENMILQSLSILDYNGFNVSCFGEEDASVLSSVTGGVGPYDYSSNGGLTFEESNITNQYQFSNLGAGLIDFQVKDANECISNLSVELISPQEVIPSLALMSQIDCNNDDDAVLLASVSGGVGAYNFILNDVVNTNSILSVEESILFEGLSAGFYELNVVDANGCSNSILNESQLLIGEPSPITYDMSSTSISCNDYQDAVIQISNISGGTGNCNLKFFNSLGYFYEQSDLGNFDLLVFDNLYSSTYTILISDENGCGEMDEIEVTDPDELLVALTPTDASCFSSADGSILVNVTGGNLPYQLSLNGVNYTTNESISIDELEAGDYEIFVQDVNGCNLTSSTEIGQPDSIIISSSVVDNICFGLSNGSAIFTVSGGIKPYQYQFSSTTGKLISQSDTINNLASDDYTFIVSDANGCNLESIITINEPEQIVVEHEVSNESCPNANDGVIVSTVFNFQSSFETFWSSDLLSGLNNTAVPVGDYIITIVDNNGCFITDSVSVAQAPEFYFTTTTSSSSCNYLLDGELILDFDNDEMYSASLLNDETFVQLDGTDQIIFSQISSGDYNLSINFSGFCVYDTIISIDSGDGYDCIVPEPTFSPNYDGLNDQFRPFNTFDQTVELFIYNRWGAQIYYENSSSPAWDGTDPDGQMLPTADYYYIVKFNNAVYKDITGIITLLK